MDADDSESRDETTTKLPYEAPQILESESFETIAMACGKTSGPTCVTMGGLTGS